MCYCATQGILIMLQDSCPLTLFVFVFRRQGMHFGFKINGIKTRQLQLKQDKYINHPSVIMQKAALLLHSV